jgi:hypothetical protein
MGGDPLRGNFHLVNSLRSALHKGEHGLSTVPGLLKRVLVEGSWREFVTERGEHIQHERFVEFVTAAPMKGIGATVRFVQKVVDSIEDKAERAEVQDLLDRALQNPVGGSDMISLNEDNIHDENDLERPSGTSRDRALRKLRVDAPDLHAEVLAGKLSAHRAMVEAGFRPRTFTLRPEPVSAARTLRKYLTPDQLTELARLLIDD